MKRQELDEYRDLLEILPAHLQGDVSQLTSDALGSDREDGSSESKSPTHMAELGSEAFEQDFALSLVENEQETLDEISEALDRVKNGTYGICQMCLESGKTATQAAIPKARLRVIPFARNCIECERKRTTELNDKPLLNTVLFAVLSPIVLVRDTVAKARTANPNGIPLFHWLVFLIASPLLLAWDLYSKWLVFSTLGYEHRQSDSWLVWLWGKDVFRLMTSFNHGALWGMGQGFSNVFALLSVVAALAVVYWLFVARGAQSLWLTVSLTFVMAGTLGNLYDRLGMHGLRNDLTGQIEYAVRDFLYFEIINWPIFNFADTFLVTGAIMLLIQSFQAEVVANKVTEISGAQPAGGPSA